MTRRWRHDARRGAPLGETYPAERWLIEVTRGARRTLALSSDDRSVAERGFAELVQAHALVDRHFPIPGERGRTFSVPGSGATRLELVHVTIDNVGRELSRSVLRAYPEVH